MTQIDLDRLGQAGYMCELGDAMADCGISSLRYNDDGEIVDVQMRGTREEERLRGEAARKQQDVGYQAFLDGLSIDHSDVDGFKLGWWAAMLHARNEVPDA